MKISISRIHLPIENLGWGRRIGIWVQGCSIGCAGCIAVDTWAPDDDRLIEVADVIDWIGMQDASEIDGVTISGGEPFEQAEALDELLAGLDAWRRQQDHAIDLLGYSGFTPRTLRARYRRLARRLDAVVAGPFVQARLGRQALRGSDNQRVLVFTRLGRSRYRGRALRSQAAQRGVVHLAVDSSVWAVGIPLGADARTLGSRVRDIIRLRRGR